VNDPRALAAVAAAVLAVGCGRGGTWTDDPANFERAWGVAKPAEVDLVRSWYWRSPHWTREEAYFFHLRAADGFAEEFSEANGLVAGETMTGSAISGLSWSFDRPEWFAPRADATYESWDDAQGGDRRVFRNADTGDVFVYACQL